MPRKQFNRRNSENRYADPTVAGVYDEEDDGYEQTPLRHVYFLLDAQAAQIKVGSTTRPLARRQRELEKQRGRPLDLLGSLRGGYDLERAMHGRFRDYRVEANEWYSSEIIGDVAALLAA